MHRVSLQLINYLAKGMGKTKDYFDPWFKNECHSEFRAIHYLSRDQTIEG
jgi:isopenicillin N synthase-like dioxygenase